MNEYKLIKGKYGSLMAEGLHEHKEWVRYVSMRFECGFILSEINFDDYIYDVVDDGEEFKKFAEEWPSIYDQQSDTVWLKIDVTDGTVVNWPEGKTADFSTVKLVDTAEYELYDKDNILIASYRGYVPELLSVNCKGWGDYLEFYINKERKIVNWSFPDDKFEEFLKNCD